MSPDQLPAGVASRDEIGVASWAEDLEADQTVAFEVDDQVLEAEIIGFSQWDQYRGLPVVRPPDGIVVDGIGSPDLLTLREQDIIDGDGRGDQAVEGVQ